MIVCRLSRLQSHRIRLLPKYFITVVSSSTGGVDLRWCLASVQELAYQLRKLKKQARSLRSYLLVQGTSRAQAGHKQGTSTEQAEAYVPKSNNVRKLIEAIGTATLTMNEIMTTMGFRSRSQFHSNYMKAAIEDGAVEMENPDSPNDSNQKYRLTSKGLGFLNSKKDN